MSDTAPPSPAPAAETASHSAATSPASPAEPIWITALAVLFGGVWLFSAFTKMHSFIEFESILLGQHITSSRGLAEFLARALGALELTMAVGLLVPGWRRRIFLPTSFVILIGFTGYMIWVATGGSAENCGCFGNVLPLTPWQAVGKNVVMLVANAVLLRRVADPTTPTPRWPVPLLAVVLLATFLAFPARRYVPPVPAGGPGTSQAPDSTVASGTHDEHAHGSEAAVPEALPSPFAKFNAFQPTAVDLTRRVRVVAFLSLDCDHCLEVATQLVMIRDALDTTPIAVVFLGDAAAVPGFFARAGGEFPWMIASPMDFFEMIGSAPPRVYVLRKGQPTWYADLESFTVEALVQQAIAPPAP